MNLHHCSCDQSALSQKCLGEHWESMHSCDPAAPQIPHNRHTKHKLCRTLSDPGLASSMTTLEMNAPTMLRELRNITSVDDSFILSVESTLDSLEDIHTSPNELDCLPCSGAAMRIDDLETTWTSNNDNEHLPPDSMYYDDEVVNLDDYYYEDEETKSQIFPFRKCSLRFHGLLFLILIYAAGFLAYIIVSPSSKRRCQRPPTLAPPMTP